jgi:hypothetical protein
MRFSSAPAWSGRMMSQSVFGGAVDVGEAVVAMLLL